MDRSITIFTVARAFCGAIGVSQRNAIRSWVDIASPSSVLIFGNEEGVAEFAQEIGARHNPHCRRNNFLSPRLDGLFPRAEELAPAPVMVFCCADTILPANFGSILDVAVSKHPRLLLTGRAHELSEADSLSLSLQPSSRPAVLDSLNAAVASHSPSNRLRYFAYPAGVWDVLPPLAIGGPVWERWLVADAVLRGIEVIDATSAITCFHQSHDYRHTKWGSKERLDNSFETELDLAQAKEGTVCAIDELISLRCTPQGQIVDRSEIPGRQALIERLKSVRVEQLFARATAMREEAMALDREGRSHRGLMILDRLSLLGPKVVPGLALFRSICLMNMKRYEEAIAVANSLLSDTTPENQPFIEDCLAVLALIQDRQQSSRA